MATRANPRKYKRNPDYPAERFSLNGVVFTEETVVEGDHWERYTQALFPNIPPQLVYATQDAGVTAGGSARSTRPQRDVKPPTGTTTASLRSKEEATAGDGGKTVVSTGSSPAPAPAPKPAPAPAPKPTLPPAPKPAPAPKPEPKPEPEEPAPKPDDLTVINGVGESRAESLVEAGFPTVKSVANADPNVLLERVRETGARMNLATARTIVRQAKLVPKE